MFHFVGVMPFVCVSEADMDVMYVLFQYGCNVCVLFQATTVHGGSVRLDATAV